MFGNTNHDHKRSVMAMMHDDRLTPAQRAAYCFDQGICDICGIKTHWVGPFKRRPYSNEKVYQGICRTCHPDKLPREAKTVAASGRGLVGSWNQLQIQLAIPPDVLLAKTTTAFKGMRADVTKGINNLTDNINQANGSGAIQEHQQKMVAGTNRALTSMHSSLTVGVGHVTAGTNNATEKTEQLLASQNKKRSQAKQPAFSGLKTNFKASNSNGSEASSSELSIANGGPGENDLPSQSSNASAQPALEGKAVITPFGHGQVVDYRQEDDIYVIHLHQSSSSSAALESQQADTNHNTKLYCKKESFSLLQDENKSQQKQAMAINEAYESLEKMRRLNLELECQERGVHEVDFDKCTFCLLKPQAQPQNHQNFPRIRRLVNEQQAKKAPTPCLFCAAPSCQAHACATFRKEGITACQECVKFFETDYIVNCVNHAHSLQHTEMGDTKIREQQVDHMIDLYDRVVLLLQYSGQYIESIAVNLEENIKNKNNVDVGSSSVGIVSGALGVAAAACLFTPAGPPLLVTSLLLGGSATAVQTGTEIQSHYSESNRFADRIIALIGMVHSLLQVKENLREVLTARLLEEQGNPEIDRLKKSLLNLRDKQRNAAVKAGTSMASTAVLGGVALGAVEIAAGAAAVESAALVTTVEVGTIASRQANMLTKSSTAVARGARFARFAGGALSVATVALEVKTLSTTIKQINAGNPCEKANTLRTIVKELPLLPTSEQLDEECRIYMGAMSNRVNANSLEDAINLIESKAIQEWQMTKAAVQEVVEEGDLDLTESGASILGGEEDASSNCEGSDDLALLTSSLKMEQEQRLAQSMSNLPIAATNFADQDIPATTNNIGGMSQSTTQLPSASIPHNKHSALLQRIQKFKHEESY